MDILLSGLLKDNNPFYIRRLHLKDLDIPSSLTSFSQKEYEYILVDGGKMVGVFVDERVGAMN